MPQILNSTALSFWLNSKGKKVQSSLCVKPAMSKGYVPNGVMWQIGDEKVFLHALDSHFHSVWAQLTWFSWASHGHIDLDFTVPYHKACSRPRCGADHRLESSRQARGCIGDVSKHGAALYSSPCSDILLSACWYCQTGPNMCDTNISTQTAPLPLAHSSLAPPPRPGWIEYFL